jgi:hypothetical protein
MSGWKTAYSLVCRGERKVTIYPYSLDGLPMVPKAGKIIDDYFDQQMLDRQKCLAQLKSDLDAGTIKDVEDILYRIAGVVMTVYNKFDNPYAHQELEFEEGKTDL